MPKPWTCLCGHRNLTAFVRCGGCGGVLEEVEAALAGRKASCPEGVPADRGRYTDPETDPTCLGTKAFLDGVVSGLDLSERRAYLDWLAYEVQIRLAQNEYATAAMGDNA
jgi:hypothetical protein